MCGGTTLKGVEFACLEGLSPRVRGNPCGRPSSASNSRSIPACAGEPRVPKALKPPGRVYPRVCGGTPAADPAVPPIAGLSPRVRGNLWEAFRLLEWKGSIPACAGEPEGGRCILNDHRVYPRVCGGTTYDETHNKIRTGLSPRVRGNPWIRN